jgi:glycosyltransferase involved in cell wall biosynthesis
LDQGNGARPSDVQHLPSVSVIVPTYNRAVSLEDTLRDLISQDYPAGLLEIVVVDNSSTDHTEEVVRRAAAASSFPLAFYRKENRGPAASRNFGIARSSGDILAFTDSDCRASALWVRMGVAHITDGVGLVAGPVIGRNNPARVPGFFHHQIDHKREDLLYATANVFYRRDIVEQLGGFNEAYGTFPFGLPVGGEDTDLAWRVRRGGYRAKFVPELAVHHEATDMSPVAWLMEPVRAQIMPKLVREFPDLRSALWARYFFSQEQALFYPALAGMIAAATRRRAWPLLLIAPWLYARRSMVTRDRLPSRWWRIPIKYGLTATRHLVLTAAVVSSSVRHRTPVF